MIHISGGKSPQVRRMIRPSSIAASFSGGAAVRFGETRDTVTLSAACDAPPAKPQGILNKAFGTPAKNLAWTGLWAALGVGTLLLLQPHLAIGCFAVAGVHTVTAAAQAIQNHRKKTAAKKAEQSPNKEADRKEDKKRDEDPWGDDDLTDCSTHRHHHASGKGNESGAKKCSHKNDHHDDDDHGPDDDLDWDDD